MRYGNFDDEKKEYCITNPRTPYPWINYLGTEDFFSIISNTAGGYSFYKDAGLRRITRFRYNNVPIDEGGKYFYINDGANIWSPGWKPVKNELDYYECRHGLNYTIITGEKNNIKAEVKYFVPLGQSCEIQKVTLINTGKKTIHFRLFSFVEFCLWNALDDMTNLQRNLSTGEVEVKGSTIYHKTEYRERRNHYAFYSVNTEIQGFDSDREIFTGLYKGLDSPEVVTEGISRNSIAHGWSPIASHMLEIKLAPKKKKELVFILGYIENDEKNKWESKGVINKQKAEALMEIYKETEASDKAFDDLKNYWADLLSIYNVKSNEDKLDRLVNIWNQYQCMVTYNMSRSASYFKAGTDGEMLFRDLNHDLTGLVHQIPEKAKERILDIAATQFEDGGVYHQYKILAKRGNKDIGGNFNDDPLWLIHGTISYVKETGDFSILDKQVPFDNDESKSQSLFEHLKRSFYHVANNLGPHNLPLIGRDDWNECSNLDYYLKNPDDSIQAAENKKDNAESVMNAGMLVLFGTEFAELCNRYGRLEDAADVFSQVEKMRNSINQHGWDGEWFLSAYDNFGQKVGSRENEEGKIFVDSQGLCVMAGIGIEDGRARQALDSIKTYLDSDYGIVLNSPAFTAYNINYGKITSYPEGYKENGGVLCDNNPWIIIGETILGNGRQAFEYYRKIAPSYLEDISDLHKTEPYVYSQTIAGKDAFKPGEAKNSWLTSAAALNFYAITQYILGIRPDYEGLLIEPCIPSDWEGFTVQRKFRKAQYVINVQNPSHISKGIREITIDGEKLSGNILPVYEDGKIHDVEVMMGQE